MRVGSVNNWSSTLADFEILAPIALNSSKKPSSLGISRTGVLQQGWGQLPVALDGRRVRQGEAKLGSLRPQPINLRRHRAIRQKCGQPGTVVAEPLQSGPWEPWDAVHRARFTAGQTTGRSRQRVKLTAGREDGVPAPGDRRQATPPGGRGVEA